jgi:crotonobetainyl-CoA hydratase
VIAAVNSVAFGGGSRSRGRRHLSPPNAAFALLKRRWARAGRHAPAPLRVGLVAMGTMLTGRMIGPERARTLGLVNDVTKPGESLARALEWARSIEECSPAAVGTILDVVRSGLRFADERQALEHAYPSLEELRSHPDFAEGPRAFAEKRTPQWQKQSRD